MACRENFFLPVRVLSRVFRGKFVHLLRKAFQKGELTFHGDLVGYQTPCAFERLLDAAVTKDWIVYAKPPFGGPQQVLKYLARYTHRVAISNQRMIGMDDGKVGFRWKDYADGNTEKTMTLDACEFIRRFLLHVLPSGFVKIRHYGFLSNRFRREKLALARRLLGVEKSAAPAPEEVPAVNDTTAATADAVKTCPACDQGVMVVVERLPKSLALVLHPPIVGTDRPLVPPAVHNSS